MSDPGTPTFFLEKVVRTRRDEPEDFTGPLELILLLLSKNRLEIRDIRISELLEQYLSYLAKMQELDLDIASGFVQMAAHLMYIKTKMLLAGEKEVEELETLVASLEQLKCRETLAGLRAVLPVFAEALETGLCRHTKPPEPRPAPDPSGSMEPVCKLSTRELLMAIAPLLLQGSVRKDTESTLRAAAPRPIVYGVRQKGRQLLRLLREEKQLRLSALFSLCGGRSELVATFLAVLDLSADGLLLVTKQGDDFSVAAISGDREEG